MSKPAKADVIRTIVATSKLGLTTKQAYDHIHKQHKNLTTALIIECIDDLNDNLDDGRTA